MLTLSLFDNRTLFAGNFVLATVFAVLFLAARRAFPQVRGMGAVAWSFALTVPAILLIGGHGQIPDVYSALLGNACTLASFGLMYEGIVRVCGGRPRMLLVWVAGALELALVAYFTVVRPELVPRVMTVGLATGVLRGLMAAELLRHSAGSANRLVMRLFGLFLAVLALLSAYRVAGVMLHGVSNHFESGNPGVTITLGLMFVYLCVAGCSFLAMATCELILRAQRESERDEVSGALNRRGIDDRLELEMEVSARLGSRLSVCLLDVDYFKQINDRLGHAAGDAALRGVGDTLASCVRGRDHVGRYGGDEFLLVLTEAGSAEGAIVADRVQESLASAAACALSVSIGIAEMQSGDTRDLLLARADAALYRSKHDGRNCRRVAVAASRHELVAQAAG